jgi:hypothetical protein
MRVVLITAAAILATALLPRSVNADTSSYAIGELLEVCMEGDNDSRWGQFAETECEHYVIGFVNANVLTSGVDRDDVCLPPTGNRADEIRWALMKRAHKIFKDREMPAADGLLATIRSVFACNKE